MAVQKRACTRPQKGLLDMWFSNVAQSDHCLLKLSRQHKLIEPSKSLYDHNAGYKSCDDLLEEYGLFKEYRIFGLKCTFRGDIQHVTNFSVFAFQKTYMVSNIKTIQNEGLTASHYW